MWSWKYSLVVIFFISSALTISTGSASSEDWMVSWGGPTNEYSHEMAINNTDIYITGRIYRKDASNSDIFLLKYDHEGNLLWNRTWGTPHKESVTGLAIHRDGVYLTGEQMITTSNVVIDTQVFLLKYNGDGNLIFNRTWGRSGVPGSQNQMESSEAITLTSEGTFIAGKNGSRSMILKLDHYGIVQWNRMWEVEDMVQYPLCLNVFDGNLLVTGSYRSLTNDYDNSIYLSLINSDGVEVWNTTWGESENVSPVDATVDNDVVYVAAMSRGEEIMEHVNQYDIVLLKFDISGALLWNTTWGESSVHERPSEIEVMGNSVYIIGKNMTFTPSNSDILLLEYGFDGGLSSVSTWSGPGNETNAGIGFIDDVMYISGSVDNLKDSDYDVFLIRVPGSLEELPSWEVMAGMDSTGISGERSILSKYGIYGSIIIVASIWYLWTRLKKNYALWINR